MKSSSIFRIAGIIFLTLLIFLSCKKKEDDPITPLPTPLPWDTVTSKVIPGQKLDLTTDYEDFNALRFPSAVICQTIGKADTGHLLGGGAFSIAFSVLGKIYDYYHHKAEMAELYDTLNSISNEIKQISTEIQALALQMNIQTQEILNKITVQSLSNDITHIQISYSDSTSSGFLNYYSNLGRLYQQGTIPDVTMHQKIIGADTNNPKILRDAVTKILNTNIMTNAIYNIHNNMIGEGPGITNSMLYDFAKYILLQRTGRLMDINSFQTGYELIENFFQYYLNYEFMAVTVQVNSQNLNDPTGGDASTTMNDFRGKISQQLQVFQNIVDYYVINGYDYRYTTQYSSDMDYVNLGLAPDQAAMNIMARSRFLVNTYLDALSLPYPTYCGSFILPRYYSMDRQPIPDFDIQMGGVNLTRPVKNTVSSQVPYAYWSTLSNTWSVQVAQDFQWSIYHLGQTEDATHQFSCNALPVKILDNGSNTFPWFHLNPIQGSVTPLYYNPQNPNQTSTVKNGICTMKFSFIAAAWRWGFMKLVFTNLTDSRLYLPSPYEISFYNSKMNGHGWVNSHLCQWGIVIAQYHGSQSTYDDYTQTCKNGWYPFPNKAMTVDFYRNMDQTNNTWIVYGMNGFDIYRGGGISGSYFLKYWMNSYFGRDQKYSIGFILSTGYTDDPNKYWNFCNDKWVLPIPDMNKQLITQNLFGPNIGSVADTRILADNNGNNLNFYWYWTNWQPPAYPVHVSFDLNLQYVPSGLGSLP